ncbi:MAG: hypothetical protein COA49_00045 [Bacteroidetes bacterium]|nr:MAG: hypothetical protein COA49_00045 [Bacteroidota bacterium]
MIYSAKDGFPYYLNLVKDLELQTLFSDTEAHTFLNSFDNEKAEYRYAPNKWNIKQIIGHLTDHERIMMYRAYLMSRNKEIQLWSYDQNFLVDNSVFEELTLKQLMTDLINVRNASISFIDTLSESQLKIEGLAQHFEINLKDYLKTIIGHEKHHINIIKERYL